MGPHLDEMSINYNEEPWARIDTGIDGTVPSDISDWGAAETRTDPHINSEHSLDPIDISILTPLDFGHVSDFWQLGQPSNQRLPDCLVHKDLLLSDISPFGDWVGMWAQNTGYPMSQVTCSSETGISDFPVEETPPSGLSTMPEISSPPMNWAQPYLATIGDHNSFTPQSSEMTPNAYDTSLPLGDVIPSVITSSRTIPIPPAKRKTLGDRSSRRRGRKRVEELRSVRGYPPVQNRKWQSVNEVSL
jgi:hypothetical protein